MMSRNEFKRIKKALVVDIPFWLKNIPKKWREMWNCSSALTFDETIVLFKGRIKFRIHIKGKPHADTGIRFMITADSKAYYLCVEPYMSYQPKMKAMMINHINLLKNPQKFDFDFFFINLINKN